MNPDPGSPFMIDLRARLQANATLTPEQRHYLLSLISPPQTIAAGDVIQVDAAYDPDKLGGVLLVATGAGNDRFVEGLMPDWGMQCSGPIAIRAPLDRIKHTRGHVHWPLDVFLFGNKKE